MVGRRGAHLAHLLACTRFRGCPARVRSSCSRSCGLSSFSAPQPASLARSRSTGRRVTTSQCLPLTSPRTLTSPQTPRTLPQTPRFLRARTYAPPPSGRTHLARLPPTRPPPTRSAPTPYEGSWCSLVAPLGARTRRCVHARTRCWARSSSRSCASSCSSVTGHAAAASRGRTMWRRYSRRCGGTFTPTPTLLVPLSYSYSYAHPPTPTFLLLLLPSFLHLPSYCYSYSYSCLTPTATPTG